MEYLKFLEINLKNLKYNVRNLKSLLEPETKFMAVVKSNAYGHGILECAKSAIEAGADWLGVVNLDEAISLRKSEKSVPILVLGYVAPNDFSIAAKNDISIAVVNWEQLNYLKTISKSSKLKMHLKIETGISRLGFTEEDWQKLIEEIKKLPKNIVIEGIYSHFASVEEYDLAYARRQIEKFVKFRELFNSQVSATKKNPIYHMAASAAAMILSESHFDMVRCGISIYGLWPSRETRDKFESKKSKVKSDFLKPVLGYKTQIVQIKDVKRGDYIGYGCTYPVDRPMAVAVIPVGYAEGFDRGFSNPAPAGNKPGVVLIGGKRCPVIGRICMNMTVIDITELKTQNSKLKIGEEVILIGRQGKENTSADEWAEKLGTINYEITTRIPENIARTYIS